jgi:DNA-binding FrmR family transcriptional regulator
MEREELNSRLRKVEGQIRGLQRMIEGERDCEDILTQLMAARAALDKVGVSIVSGYLEECLMVGDVEKRKKKLTRAMELVFSRYSLTMEPTDTRRRDDPEQ